MEKAELAAHLGHVSSAVGHQVINSLSTIVSQAEILRTLMDPAGPDLAEIQERIDTVIRVSLDASTLTRRLLEVAHDVTAIEPPHPGEPLAELDLSAVAAEFVETAQQGSGRSAQWVLDLHPIARVKGNAAMALKALRLLADNALEALPEAGGTIVLATLAGPRDWVTLEMRDNGFGMPAEVVEHAAEPFYSTKPGRKGLGLTIARGIWRRHRGGIVIESKPGEGTTIRLTVPPSTSP
ncbi:MAG: HAMP domain-containing sensor histidine kinase [Isosphaeraceae bacterium]